MDAREFRNAIKIMMSLDRHDLIRAGVIGSGELRAWKAFRDFPHETSLHLTDANFAKLFDLIQSRQPKQKDAA